MLLQDLNTQDTLVLLKNTWKVRKEAGAQSPV